MHLQMMLFVSRLQSSPRGSFVDNKWDSYDSHVSSPRDVKSDFMNILTLDIPRSFKIFRIYKQPQLFYCRSVGDFASRYTDSGAVAFPMKWPCTTNFWNSLVAKMEREAEASSMLVSLNQS